MRTCVYFVSMVMDFSPRTNTVHEYRMMEVKRSREIKSIEDLNEISKKFGGTVLYYNLLRVDVDGPKTVARKI